MSTYKIKKGNYYYATSDGRVEEVNPYDVKVDGVSYKLHKDLYKNLDLKHQQLNEYVETSKYAIRAYLSKNGIDTPNDDLKSLINDLNTLKTIVSGVEYLNFALDNDGYVLGVEGFNTLTNELVNVIELPDDIDNRCYMIVDGELVLDEEEKERRGVII